jgi:hypothetical protein
LLSYVADKEVCVPSSCAIIGQQSKSIQTKDQRKGVALKVAQGTRLKGFEK